MSTNCHCFNVELATRLGLAESILLQHFYYWHQRAQQLPEMLREGRTWFFRSVAEIRAVFPYLTDSNIRTAIQHLLDAGLVVKGDYSSASMNKATWYSLNDSAIRYFDLSESANAFVESANGFTEIRKSISNSKDNRINIENNERENKGATRFVKPTLEEVAAYCRERGNTIDPQTFIDHYTSNGWKVGSNPMKDWKAAVRTWEAKRKNEAPNPRPFPQQQERRYISPEERTMAALARLQARDGMLHTFNNPDEQ